MDSIIERAKSAARPMVRDICQHILPGGRVDGRHYVCSGVDGGNGRSLKVDLSSGAFKDFSPSSQSDRGDIVELWSRSRRIGAADAAREILEFCGEREGELPISPVPSATVKYGEPPPGRKPSFPVGDLGKPVKMWRYNEGSETTFVCRYDNGEKSFRQWRWDESNQRFTGGASSVMLPLYHKRVESAARVIIVEGEKACDAANRLINGSNTTVATTFRNGAAGWKSADLSQFKGKRVVVWPDNDAGRDSFEELAQSLVGVASSVTLISYPAGCEPGCDIADMGWSSVSEMGEFIRANSTIVASGIMEVVDHDSEVARIDMQSAESLAAIGVHVSRKGIPANNLDTAYKIVNAVFGDKIHLDEFRNKTYICGRPITDKDYIDIQQLIQDRSCVRNMSKVSVIDAVAKIAGDNKRNEPVEYFTGLEWDGTPRVERYMHSVYGCRDTEYTRAVSRNFFIMMMARTFDPGCWVDNMVVLEGSQGLGKSKSLELLAVWFKSVSVQVGHNAVEFLKNISGAILIEIPELAAFSRADANHMKSLITTSVDEYRKSYAREPGSYPRRCVFVGTTNDSDYIKDDTGGRRFWPIPVQKQIDFDYIREHRDQLFAEAYVMYKRGDTWHEVPDEAEGIQGDRYQADPWESHISGFLRGISFNDVVPMSKLMDKALEIPRERQHKGVAVRIARIMRRIGYEKSGENWVKPVAQLEIGTEDS